MVEAQASGEIKSLNTKIIGPDRNLEIPMDDFDGNVKKLIDKFDIAGNLVVNTTGATNGVAEGSIATAAKLISGTSSRASRAKRGRPSFGAVASSGSPLAVGGLSDSE